MANQLPPEAIAYLMQHGYTPGNGDMPQYVDPKTGLQYFGKYTQGTYGGEGSNPSMTLNGYSQGNYNTKTGGDFNTYDLSGNATGQEHWDADKGAWMDDVALAAMGLTVGGLSMFGPNGFLAGGGQAAGAGANPAMWGDAGTMFAGTDAAAAGSLGGGASLSSVAPLAASGAGAGAGAGSLLDAAKAAASGAPSWLGPATALLGAAAGSQPQKQSETVQKDLPEFLKPYVTGQGGLLGQTQNLLNAQMGYVPQQAQQVSNAGLGLLQRPVAGNGYGLFASRPFGG